MRMLYWKGCAGERLSSLAGTPICDYARLHYYANLYNSPIDEQEWIHGST